MTSQMDAPEGGWNDEYIIFLGMSDDLSHLTLHALGKRGRSRLLSGNYIVGQPTIQAGYYPYAYLNLTNPVITKSLRLEVLNAFSKNVSLCVGGVVSSLTISS